jgi:hypothetical protein
LYNNDLTGKQSTIQVKNLTTTTDQYGRIINPSDFDLTNKYVLQVLPLNNGYYANQIHLSDNQFGCIILNSINNQPYGEHSCGIQIRYINTSL